MKKVEAIILHNIRSAHNVGAILRTAEGFGVKTVYMSGITPYPKQNNDSRLPHVREKTHSRITKTSLGAEDYLDAIYVNDIYSLITNLSKSGYKIVAIEQSKLSVDINNLPVIKKSVLIFGNEVDGIDENTLKVADLVVQIPMKGKKESFNVSASVAIVLQALSAEA